MSNKNVHSQLICLWQMKHETFFLTKYHHLNNRKSKEKKENQKAKRRNEKTNIFSKKENKAKKGTKLSRKDFFLVLCMEVSRDAVMDREKKSQQREKTWLNKYKLLQNRKKTIDEIERNRKKKTAT